jgi:hypothetical protein
MKAWGNSNQNLYGSKLDQAVYRRVIVSFFSDAPFPTERVTVFLITPISSFPARMQFAGINHAFAMSRCSRTNQLVSKANDWRVMIERLRQCRLAVLPQDSAGGHYSFYKLTC